MRTRTEAKVTATDELSMISKIAGYYEALDVKMEFNFAFGIFALFG